MRTKLRYGGLENLQLVSTTGALAKYVFSANSTFDPDRTSTGHQPLYRDTYAAIYNQYAVIASKLTVMFINSNAANVFNIGITCEDDAAGTSTVDTIAEQSTSTNEVLGVAASSRSVVTLTKTFDCAKNLSIDPFASETYKTSVGSNPAEEYFFFIWANEIGSGTATIDIQCMLEYDVLFSELTTPTQSQKTPKCVA